MISDIARHSWHGNQMGEGLDLEGSFSATNGGLQKDRNNVQCTWEVHCTFKKMKLSFCATIFNVFNGSNEEKY